MWLMCEIGFYSATTLEADGSGDELQVRTRAFKDARNLSDWMLVEHGVELPVVTKPASDYPWRVIMSRELWGSFVLAAAEEIDYNNFKSRVAEVNAARAKLYGDVWWVMLAAEDEDLPPAAAAKRKPAKSVAQRVLWDDLYRDPFAQRESVESIHDLTEEEWTALMEETPAGGSGGGSRKGRRHRKAKR